MSNKKVIVRLKDKRIEGTEINFKALSEEWNEYELEDGTIIRFKTVVSRIVRTIEYNKEDEPIYAVNSTNVVSSRVPEKLKKKG